MVLAGALGLWLGGLSVPEIPLSAGEPVPGQPVAGPASPRLSEVNFVDVLAPPLFMYADPERGGSWEIVEDEVRMSAAAGIHQYVVPISAPWNGKDEIEAVLAPMARVIAADPKAAILLKVNLNPSEDWLRANIGHAAKIGGQTKRYPAPASPLWMKTACEALEVLTTALLEGTYKTRIMGYELCALQDGLWQRPGYDESPASLAGFQEWLRRRYSDDSGLQQAWNNPGAVIDGVAIPSPPDSADTKQVFFTEPIYVDFLQYSSESTADAIAALAVHLKSVTTPATAVFAPYGYTYEQLRNDSGHFGLGVIINSDLDGFAGPVSYSDRGLGGAGALMGPVTSVLFHGKKWLLLDDTRTGVEPNPETGTLARMKGLRSEDVFNVQRRNFATALIHGLGIAWTDPEGKGWLHDEEQWEEFAKMRELYAQVLKGEQDQSEEAAVAAGDLACGRPPFTHTNSLAVVVDELSRFHVRCDEKLHGLLLHQTRDAAVRSGMSTRFYLLQDVLEDRIAPAPVYLFLNVFFLPEDDRQRLHEILRREQAAAIWMYAPGFINGSAAVENISATTRMTVKAFDGAARSGSEFALPGPWVKENEPFGQSEEWAPLFYIDDPEIDTLGRYADSGKTSLAIKFLDEGWASVFAAEPVLTPSVLREILRILEQKLYFRDMSQNSFDASNIGRGLLAIHAQQNGERAIDMGRIYNLQDLFDARIGWPQKRAFVFSMSLGETRLLQLEPLADAEGEAPETDSGTRSEETGPSQIPEDEPES